MSDSNATLLLTSLFQTGDYPKLESEARRIVASMPDNGTAWHFLGLSYLLRNMNDEAGGALTRAVAILGNDDQVLDHLGIALCRQGKHDAADECFQKSLTARPDSAGTWNNAAMNSTAASMFEKAAVYARRAIALNPGDAKVFVNLGNALKGLNDLDGAEDAYCTAAEIDTSLPEAHNNLGAVLRLKRRPEEGMQAIERALQLRPTFIDAWCNRVDTLVVLRRFDEAEAALNSLAELVVGQNATHSRFTNLWLSAAMSSPLLLGQLPHRIDALLRVRTPSRRYRGLIAAHAAVYLWMQADWAKLRAVTDAYCDYGQMTDVEDDRFARIYFNYSRDLLAFRDAHPETYNGVAETVLYVLGESHSLSPANAVFDWMGQRVRAECGLIMGVKMHHLADREENLYKRNFMEHVNEASRAGLQLLLTIGEIDCRPDSGIWVAARHKGRSVAELVEETVGGYLSFLERTLPPVSAGKVTIQGVPAPAYRFEAGNDPGDIAGFLSMITMVNARMRSGSLYRGWRFLDVYGATADLEGTSNLEHHLDGWHLNPAFYNNAHKWLITPDMEPSDIDRMGDMYK